MSAVNMSDTDWYKSGNHTQQFDNARILALAALKKKTADRISNYMISPTLCKECNKSIDYKKRHNVFCTSSCSASYNNKQRDERSVESKLKTSNRLKGLIPKPLAEFRLREEVDGAFCRLHRCECAVCNMVFLNRLKRKTCSKECASINQGNWLRANRSHIRGNGQKSYMEESFEAWLTDNCNTKWYTEVHFKNEENNRHGWIDFVFPRKKLIIELDGTHHIKRKDIDAIRDEYLCRVRGYTILRITHKEYTNGDRIDYLKSILS